MARRPDYVPPPWNTFVFYPHDNLLGLPKKHYYCAICDRPKVDGSLRRATSSSTVLVASACFKCVEREGIPTQEVLFT